LVSSFIGHELGISIMNEYDKKIIMSYACEILSSFASIDK
jgi:hypothetical protein